MRVIHKANRFRSDLFSQAAIALTTLTNTFIEGQVIFNTSVLSAAPNQWNKIIGWTTNYFDKMKAYETILAYRVYPKDGEVHVGKVRRFADGKFHVEGIDKKAFKQYPALSPLGTMTDKWYDGDLIFHFDIQKSNKEFLPATPWAGGSVTPLSDFYYDIYLK